MAVTVPVNASVPVWLLLTASSALPLPWVMSPGKLIPTLPPATLTETPAAPVMDAAVADSEPATLFSVRPVLSLSAECSAVKLPASVPFARLNAGPFACTITCAVVSDPKFAPRIPAASVEVMFTPSIRLLPATVSGAAPVLASGEPSDRPWKMVSARPVSFSSSRLRSVAAGTPCPMSACPAASVAAPTRSLLPLRRTKMESFDPAAAVAAARVPNGRVLLPSPVAPCCTNQ